MHPTARHSEDVTSRILNARYQPRNQRNFATMSFCAAKPSQHVWTFKLLPLTGACAGPCVWPKPPEPE